MSRRGAGLDRRQPRPDRGGDHAGRDRRRVPRLQREQRPAVRADLRRQGRGPERGQPRQGQRGARSAARASAWSTTSSPSSHDDGTVIARARPEARDDGQAAAGGLDGIVRPRSALGLKYVEITRGTTRRQEPASRTARTIPLRNATPQPVEIDEVFNTFNEPTRAASRSTCASSATPSPAAARTSTRRSRPLDPLLTDSMPVMRNLVRPAHAPAQLLPRAGAAAGEVAPGRRAAGHAVPQPRHDLQRARGRRPAVHPGHDQRRPAGARRRRSRSFPLQRAFLANSDGAVPRPAPGRRRAAHRGARPRRRARRRHPDAAPLAGAQHAAEPDLRSAASASPQDPLVPLGLQRPDDTVEVAGPDAGLPQPAQTTCNYVTLFFRNVARLLTEGDANGTWQRFIIIAAPAGPEQRGRPVLGAGQRPDAGQPPAQQPVPEHRLARASPRSARPATSPTTPARPSIGNAPGNQGTDDRDDHARAEAG